MNSDTYVTSYVELPSPAEVFNRVPSSYVESFIRDSRKTIQNIIDGIDKRKILVIGPCSIHDPEAALDYAQRLKALSERVKDRIFIVMRTYFEKPRTITGWKGLLYDPDMDDTGDICSGIHIVRKLLVMINNIGIPCACEFLDPNMPQYYADLISWGAIGARTTESQIHRQLASGLSCPIGFKNSTSGSCKYPINSIKSCAEPHTFSGINYNGKASIIRTSGNPYCHIVLRGSDRGSNYHDVESIGAQLMGQGLGQHRVMVDCSHGNSGKCHIEQKRVWVDIITNHMKHIALIGLMVESNILEGNCMISECKDSSNYGRSVTDTCISWTDTETLVQTMHLELGLVSMD